MIYEILKESIKNIVEETRYYSGRVTDYIFALVIMSIPFLTVIALAKFILN